MTDYWLRKLLYDFQSPAAAARRHEDRMAVLDSHPLSAAMRRAVLDDDIAAMFPPLLSVYGIGGFYLNIAAAAGLAALYMVRLRTDARTA